ncbi:hypothetical protein [Saccharothrix obliqua]|uniref:hypothetical protein n=1 Tax=Saccharothrix obliqua TaxID=2861747 RepID=UPI001C5D7403|nr:hypothetical protein [Saccharothrix obliqua]MBW4722111.1 hypothetical protein [Saccharothrix obliqua]
MTTSCPSCAWPAAEPAYPVSVHGRVSYVRCVCGLWLVLDAGRVVATAGGPGSAKVPSP